MSPPVKDVEMTPVTPDQPRRQKKQRHPVSPTATATSAKKQRSKSLSPRAANTKLRSSSTKRTTRSSTESNKSYVQLNPGTKDDVIQKMSKDNLLQEIMKIARKRSMALPKETFLKATKHLLVKRAIAFKKLSEPVKQQKFAIFHNTTDDSIMAQSFNDCCDLYKDSLKSRSMIISNDEFEKLTHIELHARLLNYRDFLKKKNEELEKAMIEKFAKDKKRLTEQTDSTSVATNKNTTAQRTEENNNAVENLSNSIEQENSLDTDKGQISERPHSTTNQGTISHDNEVSGLITQPITQDSSSVPSSAQENNNDTDSTCPNATCDDTPSEDHNNVNNANKPKSYPGLDPISPKFPRFDATNVTRVTSDSTPIANGSEEKRKLKEIRYSIVSLRTRWFGEYYKKGMDYCACEIIQKMREIDPGMCVLPTTDDADDILVHERDYEKSKQEKWLRNSFYLHNPTFNSLNFTIQVKTSKTYRWINEVITKYMIGGGNQVNIDTITANRLVTIGFFANFHRGFHNKNRIKQYCTKYLKEKHNIDAQLNIFPRNYHAGGPPENKGYLISVEVAPNCAQTINNALMRCPFDGYTNIKYMPFTKYDDNYMEKMREVIKYHSNFKTKLEIIKIPRFNHMHSEVEIITPGFSTVRDIIMSYNAPDRNFVYDVDKGPGWSTSIIYNIEAESHLDDFLTNFTHLLQQHLSTDSYKKVFQYDKPLLDLLTATRRVSSYERNHVQEVFKQFTPNVSPPPNHSIKKVNVWKTNATTSKPKTNNSPRTNSSPPTQNHQHRPDESNSSSSAVAPNAPTKPSEIMDKEAIIKLVEDTLRTNSPNPNVPQPEAPISMATVQSLISTESSKLRSEMTTEKDELIVRINSVQTSLSAELQAATSPFASTLQAVQQSNQLILSMLTGRTMPAIANPTFCNQLVPLPVVSNPVNAMSPHLPAIRSPQVKVEPDGEH